ncbi:MAG TPA: hypothetical protein DCG84_03150 [Peptococcaceae bacterium]|nr:hypothetical protein [Peptococcaceae bacterium]
MFNKLPGGYWRGQDFVKTARMLPVQQITGLVLLSPSFYTSGGDLTVQQIPGWYCRPYNIYVVL